MNDRIETPTTTRYELPEQGTSLLGYIVRRMHKTALLEEVLRHLDEGRSGKALVGLGLYAAAASASYGTAYYQPKFNRQGDQALEADPSTGALVEARLLTRQPHITVESTVRLNDRATLVAREAIEDSVIGLRGLGMPAPSLFEFSTADGGYLAHLAGTITSELVPGLFRPARIRAYGELSLGDSTGNSGRLTLDRDGQVGVRVNGDGAAWELGFDVAATNWRNPDVLVDEFRASVEEEV